MAKTILMKCENCMKEFNLKQKFTFLGFPKMTCPDCAHENLYPLSKGRKNFYLVLVALGLLALFSAVTMGGTYYPGLLFIAAVIALQKDGKISKKLKEQGVMVKQEASHADKSFCHSCGSLIDKGTKFCAKCGIKI